VKTEMPPWFPPRASARLCEKCGHIGQRWQWWRISFCRACLCFSVQAPHRAAHASIKPEALQDDVKDFRQADSAGVARDTGEERRHG
jgi:hypothetical protein